MGGNNRLLAMLPAEVYERLSPSLSLVHLTTGQVLAMEGVALTFGYFPIDAVSSIMIYGDDGDSLEVGLIGSEGMINTATFLSDGVGPGEIVVQRSGDALRMSAVALREAFETIPALRSVLLRYTQGFIAQVAQSCACNSMHSVQQRCARWLLMMADRTGTQEFDLSQALLARMLGIGRPTVSLATAGLRKDGLVQFNRGRVTIRERAGLESFACTCYGVIRDEFNRLLSERPEAPTGT
jgi:CRP-like cAMP-binding protein